MVVQAGPVAERDTGAGRDSVARFVAENRIHSVEMGVPDSNGGLRGERVRAATFVETMGRGVALSNALFVLDVAADLVEAGYTNFQTGFPDLRLRLEPPPLRLRGRLPPAG